MTARDLKVVQRALLRHLGLATMHVLDDGRRARREDEVTSFDISDDATPR